MRFFARTNWKHEWEVYDRSPKTKRTELLIATCSSSVTAQIVVLALNEADRIGLIDDKKKS